LVDILIPKISLFDIKNSSPLSSLSLYEQNMSLNTITSRISRPLLKRNYSSAFGAGNVDDKIPKIPTQFNDEYTILMTSIFNELDQTEKQQQQTTNDLLICIATTLIDNILPDSTMDTQFDDEQCKTPNERNLALVRRLEDQPFVWNLLEIISSDSNSFQLCLPIVRCLLSSLIVQWENSRGDERASIYTRQMNLSTNLIVLLKKARFLPSPLNEVYELFPYITTYDCYTLMLNTWNYLKQQQYPLPPARQQQQQQPPMRDPLYFDPIRFIIQKNISDLGVVAEHFLNLQQQPSLIA